MVSISSVQRTIFGVGIVSFLALGLFAPWDSTIEAARMIRDTGVAELPATPAGRHFILFPPKYMGYQLAFDRLVVEWLMVVVVTLGLILILKQNQTKAV